MKKIFQIAGLGFGDCGKGGTTDFLTWKYNAGLVVRYNGGCQAGHHVVMPDGRWNTFQQFGSGTFHPGVRTHLSRFMMVSPPNQMREAEYLQSIGVTDVWERTTVDAQALIVAPHFRELNRLLTLPGQRTNTTGQGIGKCRQFHLEFGDRALFAGDLKNETLVRQKLKFIELWASDELSAAGIVTKPFVRYVDPTLQKEDLIDVCWSWYKNWPAKVVDRGHLKTLLAETDCAIFEGAQGVLLDENHGEPGFNTWSDTTFGNADALLNEAGYIGKRTRVGVIRTYYTRHGLGPFPTEDPTLSYPEPHNDPGFPGAFRYGRFDEQLFRKALDICGGVDWIALNHLDQAPNPLPAEFRKLVRIEGYGPTYTDRKECPCP